MFPDRSRKEDIGHLDYVTHTDLNSADFNLKNYYTKTETDKLLKNVSVDLSDYYTKVEIDDKLANIDVGGGGTGDMSNYYTKSEIDAKGYLTSIPAEYLTSVPAEYITETELENRLAGTESTVNRAVLSDEVRTIKVHTYTEYNALATKDTNTLYILFN